MQRVLAGKEPSREILAHAGRLYDKWWAELKTDAPMDNNPLWALQTTNTERGNTIWRCAECHGWDYKGKGGAYSSGSHFTGFPGLYGASYLSREQLTQTMSGGIDYRHDFSGKLGDAPLGHIVDFIKWGTVNVNTYIDYSTKKPIRANVEHGKVLYDATCVACHGTDGMQIPFGLPGAKRARGLGKVANGDPWYTLHKIRFGDPGTSMPAGVANGWSTQYALDVLGYAQILPE